jgi:hypothetical protein
LLKRFDARRRHGLAIDNSQVLSNCGSRQQGHQGGAEHLLFHRLFLNDAKSDFCEWVQKVSKKGAATKG